MCFTPLQLKNKNTQTNVLVPCGRCPQCYKRRISGWSFRLMQEDKRSDSSLFLTFTYDTKHVPITSNGFMGLSKRDVQLFIKRLRKAHTKKSKPIRYYAAGEYGGKTNRPHYHIILFNAQLELIQPSWNLGQVHYGEVSGASVGYTLKYMSKKSKIPMHANDDRQPEFSLMSKGLGDNYTTEAMVNWHKSDLKERMYLNLEDGKKISMPRYYKQKIYTESERSEIAGHHKGLLEEKLFEQIDSTPEEKNKRAQAIIAAFSRMEHEQEKRNKI